MKRAATALLFGMLLVGSGDLAAQPIAAKTGQVVVDIVGLHSSDGRVFVAVWCGADGFPGEPKKACASKAANAQKGRLRVVFEAVRAGELAVSMIHDENSNNTLDRNFLGIPKEGWGTSRDAKASFGPPSYSDARLTLSAGEKKQVVVHVQY